MSTEPPIPFIALLEYGVPGLAVIFAALVIYRLLNPSEAWLATPDRVKHFRFISSLALGFLMVLFLGVVLNTQLNPTITITLQSAPQSFPKNLSPTIKLGTRELSLDKGSVQFKVGKDAQLMVVVENTYNHIKELEWETRRLQTLAKIPLSQPIQPTSPVEFGGGDIE
jgi:predicted PurR-regulated permease PerM